MPAKGGLDPVAYLYISFKSQRNEAQHEGEKRRNERNKQGTIVLLTVQRRTNRARDSESKEQNVANQEGEMDGRVPFEIS